MNKCVGDDHFYHTDCLGRALQTTAGNMYKCSSCSATYGELKGKFFQDSFITWEIIKNEVEDSVYNGELFWVIKLYYPKTKDSGDF